MKSKAKLFLIGALTLVTIATASLAVGCTTTTPEPPEKEAKVYSVTISYNDEIVSGVITTDLAMGEITIRTSVRKDDDADGTVSITSSVPEVAEASSEGKITLKSAGETVITAKAGSVKQDVVLRVLSDGPAGDGYAITVVGGRATPSTAQKGDIVRIEADVPEDKEFIKWTFGDNVKEINGNEFIMPDGNVDVFAVFENKLASISMVESPVNDKITFGGDLDITGLRILAKAAVSGEEWDVTKDCEVERYKDGDSVKVSYTLGEVTKTVDIPVEFVTGYEVSASSFKRDDVEEPPMNAVPADADLDLDDYKATGYICGTTGASFRFTTQVTDFSVSNFTKGQNLYFYFYSEVSGFARVNVRASSTKYYNTSGAGGTPNAVYPTDFSSQFNVYHNSTDNKITMLSTAVIGAYQTETPTWDVCGHFSEFDIAEISVQKGWNYIRFESVLDKAPNFAFLKINFIKEVKKSGTDLSSMVKLSSEATDMDKELVNYRNTGAIYLKTGCSASRCNMDVKQEGSDMSVAAMLYGDEATMYYYSDDDYEVTLVMRVASCDVIRKAGISAPVGVNEVTLKDSVSITLNGTAIDISEAAKANAFEQATGDWSVCQHFNDAVIGTISLKRGWNAFRFSYIRETQINIGNLTFVYND